MQQYTVEAVVNYVDDTADTPKSRGLSRQQLHQWLDKLLDTEPDLISFDMTVVKQIAT